MEKEQKILQSENKKFTLTSHRVRFEDRRWGGAYIISIMLEEVCSCEIRRMSFPVLLILAFLALLGGAYYYFNEEEVMFIALGVLAALLIILLYFATITQMITVASAGGRIHVSTRGMPLETARKIVEAVEDAKNQRYMLLKPGDTHSNPA